MKDAVIRIKVVNRVAFYILLLTTRLRALFAPTGPNWKKNCCVLFAVDAIRIMGHETTFLKVCSDFSSLDIANLNGFISWIFSGTVVMLVSFVRNDDETAGSAYRF